MKLVKLSVLSLSASILLGCTTDADLKNKMAKVLKDNPAILTEAIESHPAEFLTALQNAAKNAQEVMAQKRAEEEQKQLEAYYENPLKPEISSEVSFMGTKDAPITIVEYSDFECPFCARGTQTIKALLEQYKGKIQVYYKHLPLNFHENAMPAATYFEAIRLQGNDLAIKFHDEVFANQGQLKSGKTFLDSAAKKVGANMTKLKKDLNSAAVKKRIEDDMAEANKFGIQGTPGFIINGVPLSGAHPPERFISLITELQNRGKIKL